MAKSRKSKDLQKQIKSVELQKREITLQENDIKRVEPMKENAVTFDAWWLNASKLAKHPSWLKEILWAEFQTRGLSKHESKEQYDNALKLFGY